MTNFKCPDCGADLKDWRTFSEKSDIDKEKPFECVGFRCGKRWELVEVLQGGDDGESTKTA